MKDFARVIAGACSVFAMAVLIVIGVYRVVFEFRRIGRTRTELTNAVVVPTITNLVFISNTVAEVKGYGIIIYYTPWQTNGSNNFVETNLTGMPDGQYGIPSR